MSAPPSTNNAFSAPPPLTTEQIRSISDQAKGSSSAWQRLYQQAILSEVAKEDIQRKRAQIRAQAGRGSVYTHVSKEPDTSTVNLGSLAAYSKQLSLDPARSFVGPAPSPATSSVDAMYPLNAPKNSLYAAVDMVDTGTIPINFPAAGSAVLLKKKFSTLP